MSCNPYISRRFGLTYQLLQGRMQRYIPEYGICNNYRCYNLKSYTLITLINLIVISLICFLKLQYGPCQKNDELMHEFASEAE